MTDIFTKPCFSDYWKEMSQSEKDIVKFGMVPVTVINKIQADHPKVSVKTIGPGLRSCADKDGGMVC